MQRLLDLLGLAYTGTAAFECEVAFDKLLAKDALERAGVRTPAWAPIEGTALRDLGAGAAMAAAIDRVGLPCVVKPSRSGSAFGVSTVDRGSDLAAAVMAALSFSEAAIVERAVVGHRDRDRRDRHPRARRCRRSRSCRRAGPTTTPRDTPPARRSTSPRHGSGTRRPRPAARSPWRSGRACGLRDVTRVDMIVDAEGLPWVLEVNVSPGMTETSLLPMGANAVGMDLNELCETVLQSAVSRGGSSG